MVRAPRLKPGPKAEAGLRHRKAALYFCSVAHDEGWTASRISELCLELYGVLIPPSVIREVASTIKKFAELRAIDDSMVS
jgi:hypothetical protein